MPLPKKKPRKPLAFAVAAAAGPISRPLDVVEAAGAATFEPPSSRRVAAATVHASGARAGASPLPPAFSQERRFLLTTEPDFAAREAAVIPGAEAAARGALTVSTTADGASSFEAGTVTSDASEEDGGVTSRASEPEEVLDPMTGEGVFTLVAGLEFFCRGVAAADGTLVLVRPEEAVESSFDPSEDDESPAVLVPRWPRLDGALVVDPAVVDDSSEDEPAEPFVSANAIGIAEMADPTPKAIASAPTRPM